MSTYAYLGPKGTFTEAALKKITSSNDRLMPYANVTAALDAVRLGKAHFALVPIENSVEGVVARTLDELATGEPLTIIKPDTLSTVRELNEAIKTVDASIEKAQKSNLRFSSGFRDIHDEIIAITGELSKSNSNINIQI